MKPNRVHRQAMALLALIKTDDEFQTLLLDLQMLWHAKPEAQRILSQVPRGETQHRNVRTN